MGGKESTSLLQELGLRSAQLSGATKYVRLTRNTGSGPFLLKILPTFTERDWKVDRFRSSIGEPDDEISEMRGLICASFRNCPAQDVEQGLKPFFLSCVRHA